MTVRIHAFTEEYIPHILDACADWEELSKHGPPYWRPRSSAELRRKITTTSGPQPASDYNFVLEDLGRLVGECSLHGIDWRNRHAQIGICIWSLEDRHHGYGTAGVTQMVHWASDHLGLHRLEAWILADNDASRSLFCHLGFTPEAVLRERYFHDGTYKDFHVYGRLLSSDR